MTDYPAHLDEFSEEDWRQLGEEEHRFFSAMRLALDRHQDNPATQSMRCPICKTRMNVVRRDRRLTFGGWEDACIQFDCSRCCFGGEF